MISLDLKTTLIGLGIILVCIVVYIIKTTEIALKKLKNCYLYYGRVKHTRLKGGAVHSFNYPICFSYLDVDEMSHIGNSLWPIFSLNSQWSSFSSFQNENHMKDIPSTSDGKIHADKYDLPDRVRQFVQKQTNGKTVKNINILTHLTYFGYCFNPITIYYLNYIPSSSSCSSSSQIDKENANKSNSISDQMIIAEVSNTPWIEQHSYMLDESVSNVTIQRDIHKDNVTAIWYKAFHVSPFMEMDYKYRFEFSTPGSDISVNSQLIKLSTNETWFTASFQLSRIPFTPLNILYILCFYPFHTRIIQLWIHYEAVVLWWKGIPTFEHPQKSIIHFGMGITDKHILKWMYKLSSLFSSSTSTSATSNKKNKATTTAASSNEGKKKK